MKRPWIVALAAVVGLVLLFAAAGPAERLRATGPLSGRVLLWHTWTDAEADALTQVIQSFEDLYPGVTVRQQSFPSQSELIEQFLVAVRAGLGPDVVIVPSAQAPSLAQAGALAAVDELVEEEILARFMPATLEMLRVNGALIGLPESLNTQALYVNRSLVETPVNSLDGLIAQANAGTTVLLPTNFADAFWGIQAFGGRLFDEDGRVILDQGGFANWLAWLRDARNAPGMIQDSNREVLRQRFVAGEGGYYVGYATELNGIVAALGADNVAVLALPGGPLGSAGPLLGTRAFVFSSVSSQNQQRIAVELAKFVTNSEQSARLMRLAGHVPANTRVRINARLNPIPAAFAAQARSAVPLPIRPEYEAVARLGNEAYSRVLEGGESPADVAFGLTNTINEANGFVVASDPTYACTGLGTVRLAYTWQSEEEQAALEELTERFRAICPLIIVEVEQMDATQLRDSFLGNGTGLRPTFALVSQATLRYLSEEPGLLKNMTAVVTSETLQKFWPGGLEAMRVQGSLYGIPLNLNVNALYYNRRLVSEPAQTLEDLRSQAGDGVPVTLDTRFFHAFWGVGAFGGQLFDQEYRVVLDQGGFAEWLAWLRESRDVYGIRLSDDGDQLREWFMNGQSAYYVGGPQELAELRRALGDDVLGVAVLPSGPGGDATPFAQVRGFVYRESAGDALVNLARTFARFATDPDSQSYLMETVDKVPAHAAVPLGADSVFAVFSTQFQTARLVPNHPAWATVERMADEAYRRVLEEGEDAQVVVAQVTTAINAANGIAPLVPTPTPEPAPSVESPTVEGAGSVSPVTPIVPEEER